MMKKVFSLALALCFAAAGVANAGITLVEGVVVDNTAGSPNTDGFITNDVLIDFTGQYTGSQMLIDLGGDAPYVDGFGSGILPQNGAFFPLAPSLQFHSMVALGTPESSTSNADASTGPWGNPNINGNAVDLGSVAGAESFNSLIDIAWGPGGTNPVVDQTGFLVSRLTLPVTANGTGSYLASADGEITILPMVVENGVVYFIPEPASIALFGMGLVGIAFGRRRS